MGYLTDIKNLRNKKIIKNFVAGILGGLMMGIGARFAFGCNIGAFIGGIASGSLHGWVWISHFALLGTKKKFSIFCLIYLVRTGIIHCID